MSRTARTSIDLAVSPADYQRGRRWNVFIGGHFAGTVGAPNVFDATAAAHLRFPHAESIVVNAQI